MNHIKTVSLCVVLGAAISTVGCTKKESDAAFKLRAENEMVNECMSVAKKSPELSAEQVTLFRDFCNCSVGEIFNRHTLDELRETEKPKANELKQLDGMIKEVSQICASKLGMDIPSD